MRISEAERLILDNQHMILHGLRALLWKHGSAQGNEMQDAMGRTSEALRNARVLRE